VDSTQPLRVLIVYYSRFGVVKELATCVGQGVHAAVQGADVSFLEVDDLPIDRLREGETEFDVRQRRLASLDVLTAADALIVGAPAYFGVMASPVRRLFEDCLVTPTSPTIDHPSWPWQMDRFHDKVGAAFTASATPHGGNELALHSMLTLFMHLGMLVVTPGQSRASAAQVPRIQQPRTGQPRSVGQRVTAHQPRMTGRRLARLADAWLRWRPGC